MSTVIKISNKAKQQLEQINVDHDNFLRLWVEAGGCSGLSYQAAIDDQESADDKVLYEDDTLRILADDQSARYMQGMEIDYSDDLVKAGFRFTNPNATATCGCGASFKTCESGGCA